MTPEEQRIEQLSGEVISPSAPETPNQMQAQLEKVRNRAYFAGYEAALKDLQTSLQSLALGIAETKKTVIGS
jgi:hypothetical protein